MDLHKILHADAVRNSHSVSSKKRLFQDLAAIAFQNYGIDPEGAVEALLEREILGPTGVGRGVALPHARIESLDQIVGCFIKLDRPIDFDAVDRQPVDLVFALIVPEEKNDEHLATLARIAALMQKDESRQKLRECTTNHDLYETALALERSS